MKRINKKRKTEFNKLVLAYYSQHGRDMPWRNTRKPYNILVSEIMLQQTQVDRVREKYQVFLSRFPTIEALAMASLGEVIRVWSGLGYNRRAKYLHECAKCLLKNGGVFPKTLDQLTLLPGIGRSTGAGILAFAYNQEEPMIDTNIRRVLGRVFFNGNPPRDQELYAFAKTLIPKGKGRIWNYAMLDLAATKCTARNHASDCFLMNLHGPIRDQKKKRKREKFSDSNRYIRGELLRKISQGEKIGPQKSLRGVHENLKRVRALLHVLIEEGFLVKKRGVYHLS